MMSYLFTMIISWKVRILEPCLVGGCLLVSCARSRQHPPGGYAYPEVVLTADTNYYFLPIRKFVPRKDSLMCVNGNYEYRMFQEPNLSIRYFGQDEYRLAYGAALLYPTIIVLTPEKIIVKHEKKGLPYVSENEDLLDSLERFHFRILQNRFPPGRV